MIIQQPVYQNNGSGVGGPGVPGPAGPPGGTVYVVDKKTTDYTVTPEDLGHILAFDSETSVTCTLPYDLDESFVVKAIQVGKGIIRFIGSGKATIVNPSNHRCTSGKGAEVTLTMVSKNISLTTFALTGDTAFNDSKFSFSINYSGMEGGSILPGVPGTDFPKAKIEHFKYFLRKGLTHIRLPIKWERAQPILNGPLDEGYMRVVDEAASIAKSLGMTMSLDVHNYTQYRIAGVVYYIGDPEVPISSFADLWSKLASRYSDDRVNPTDDTLMIYGNTFTQYDLMNEPITRVPNAGGFIGVTIETLKDLYQAAINAIRLVNPKPDLVVEGLGYASAYQWLDNGNDLLKYLVDPKDKLIFSAHCYLDRNNSGTHYVWAEEVAAGDHLDPIDLNAVPPVYGPLDFNIGVKRLSVFGNWITSNGLRGNVGEIGVAKESDGWLQALDRAFAYLKSQNITCTYWNSGPWYDSYPYGFGLSGIPLDNPQVAVMNKNMGIEVLNELKHTIKGPTSGAVNTESSPFTLTLSGYFRSTVVYTPSDGGQGGTFKPAKIEIPPGFNGKTTFTYTPKYNKVFQISLTNDAGIAPSPALGYSTVVDIFSNETSSVTNIIWPYKLKASYIGYCVRLKRSSDNSIRDFGFVNDQLYAALDVESIKAWAGTSTNLYIVKAYDQSGNNNDLVAPTTIDNRTSDNPFPPVDSDFAQLIFDSKGEPFFKFNASRYDMTSPINGLTGWTVMTLAKPATSTPSRIASWNLVQNHDFMLSGQFSMQGENSVPFNTTANELHSYFSRYRANTPNGIQAYKDGLIVGQADSSTASSIYFQHRNVVNVGYFKFSPTSVYVGDMKGLIIFAGAVSDTTIASIQSRMQLESLGMGLLFPTVPAQIAAQATTTLAAATSYVDTKTSALATSVSAQIAAAGLGDPAAVATAITAQVNLSKAAEERLAFIKKTQWTGHLKGLNLACAEFGASTNGQGVVSGVPGVVGTNYRYGTTAEIDYYLSKGVQIIRMPFLWERLQKTLMGDLDPNDLGPLKDLVTYATNLGIRVILDPHNYSNRVVNNANFPIGATYSVDAPGAIVTPSAVTWDMWEDFCFRLGVEFRNNPLVIFLVCNEPNKFAQQAFDQNQHAINGYRRSGAANLIQCPGNGFTSARDFLSNGNDIMENLYDPFNNFHLELHQYLNASNNGEADTVDSWAVGPLRMQKMTEWARAKGFKCHLGEFNAGTRNSLINSIELDSLREHMAYMIENSDVWVSSTIWAGGPWWGEGRNSIEPTGGVGAYVDQLRLLEMMKIKTSTYPKPSAVIDIDFTKNKIFGERSISRVLNIVQAGQTYAHGVKGDWQLWDPNKLRITGRGLMVEEGRTNYLKTIITPTDQGVTQTRCTLSCGYAAPDNTYNAFKMTLDASNDVHTISLNTNFISYSGGPVIDAVPLCVSMYTKADSSTPYGYLAYLGAHNPISRTTIPTVGYSTVFPETSGGWKRGYFSFVATTFWGLTLGITPSKYPAFGHIPDAIAGTGVEGMQFWQPQIEKGLFPTSPIFVSSKSVSETRDPDVVTFVNRALALIKGDFTLVMETEWLPQVAVDVNLLTLDGVVALKSTSGYVAGSDLGVVQVTSSQAPGIDNVSGTSINITNPRSDARAPAISDGVNVRRIPVKYGVSVRRSATSRVVVGSKIAVSVGANTTIPATTVATLGPVNGFVRNLQIYDTFMDTTALDIVLKAQ